MKTTAACIAVALLCGGPAFGTASPADSQARCKIVKKKVRGKVRKVRVCTKPKPKPPTLAKTVATITIEGTPTDAVAAFGAVWVRVDANHQGAAETVERIDPATNAVVARIAVGDGTWLAAGEGAIWAPNETTNTVSKIDPATNLVAATFPVPGVGPTAAATTPGAVWIANFGPPDLAGSVVRLNPVNGAVVSDIPMPSPQGATGVVAFGDTVWVVAQISLIRIDASRNEKTGNLPFGGEACGGMAADASAVWVASSRCGGGLGLARVDATTLAMETAVIQRQRAEDVVLGLGGVWAVSAESPTYLARINPASGKTIATMSVGGRQNARLAIEAGSLWMASSGQVVRLTPTT